MTRISARIYISSPRSKLSSPTGYSLSQWRCTVLQHLLRNFVNFSPVPGLRVWVTRRLMGRRWLGICVNLVWSWCSRMERIEWSWLLSQHYSAFSSAQGSLWIYSFSQSFTCWILGMYGWRTDETPKALVHHTTVPGGTGFPCWDKNLAKDLAVLFIPLILDCYPSVQSSGVA